MKKGKLYKVNALPSSGYSEGDIYFVKNEKKIYVRTASGWEEYNGIPVNNLTTSTTGKALDAAQGKALKQALDAGLAKKADINNIVSSWVKVVDANPNNIDPVKMGLSTNIAGCNRLAFLPADQIVIEKTTDGGVTWEDYGASDDVKAQMFINHDAASSVQIPLKDGVKSADCALRITITGLKFNVPENTPETEKVNYWTSEYVKSSERYFGGAGVFDIWVLCAYGSIKMKLETRAGNSSTWIEQKTITNMLGWTGRNMFPFSLNFGGNVSQVANTWCWRMTFSSDIISDEYSTTPHSIYSIRYYSASLYNYSNYLMRSNHLYTWDRNKNAIFPATVLASSFAENGVALVNKYANKTYNAKSFEAINIKTDNSAASKAANIAAIKAYTDNLTALGVSLTNGFIIPVRVDSSNYGVLVGSGSTPRLHGYINRDNTLYGLVVGVDGKVDTTQIQRAADSTLNTTSKQIVGAINELNGTIGLMGENVTTALNNSTNAQETANTADTKADEAKTTASSALTKATNLENAETTIAGQTVKIGGTITSANLVKGLKICSQALHLIRNDNVNNLTKITQFCRNNGLTTSDFFTIPVFVSHDENDNEPDFGVFQFIPSMSALKGTLTSADTLDPSECNSAKIGITTGEIEYGDAFANAANPEYAGVEMAFPDVNSGFQTSVILEDYLFKKFRAFGMKKYVSFSGTPSCGKKVELTLTDSSTTKLTFQHTWWNYYGSAFQTDFLQFELDLSTKVLTAMYPKGMV